MFAGNIRNAYAAVRAPRKTLLARPSANVTESIVDANEALRYTRWFLMFLRILPLTYGTRAGRKFVKLSIVACLAIIAFTFVPAALHATLREKNPHVRIMLLGPVGASFASVLKYSIIVYRADAINECLTMMKSDWSRIARSEELAIMRRHARIGREITIVCSLFLYTGGMSYHAIVPLLKAARIDEYNVTIRPLVYPGYDIFVNPQRSPTYEIIFLLICVSAFYRYTVTIAICNLAATFASHVCGQAEIAIARLGMIFDEIANETDRGNVTRKRISHAVARHANGLRLCRKIDEALREIFLIEVVAATTIICLLEYYCMMEWNNSDAVAIVTYFLLLTSYVFNIFILCYIGELLKDQFQKVGRAAYMIEWHRLLDKNGLAIVLIILMSNCSRQITAGRMMEFSMSSFGIIMKTSVMYLNMLRAIAA